MDQDSSFIHWIGVYRKAGTHKISCVVLKEVSKALVEPGVGPGEGADLVSEPLVDVLVADDAPDVLTHIGGCHTVLDEQGHLSDSRIDTLFRCD